MDTSFLMDWCMYNKKKLSNFNKRAMQRCYYSSRINQNWGRAGNFFSLMLMRGYRHSLHFIRTWPALRSSSKYYDGSLKVGILTNTIFQYTANYASWRSTKKQKANNTSLMSNSVFNVMVIGKCIKCV